MLAFFSLAARSSTEGETRLSGTIKAGTIMMKAGTIIPQSLRVETEPYSHGWEMIKNSDANALDRDIRRADWNFFFLAASIQATALGYWGEKIRRRAMERVLTKAEPSKFNCLEITEVSAKAIPWLSLRARLRRATAYPEELISTRIVRTGEPVVMPTGLLPEALLVRANNLLEAKCSTMSSQPLPLASAMPPA